MFIRHLVKGGQLVHKGLGNVLVRDGGFAIQDILADPPHMLRDGAEAASPLGVV